MDAGRLGDFENGNSVSFTAERTQYRGMRRLRGRFLLRRERLLRVLRIMGMLPKHFASQLDRYGKLPADKEPKLAWRDGTDGKPEFLFKQSFEEMVANFRQYGHDGKVPYDWTIYYLRKKALSHPLTNEELAWVLMQFNQKRGYNQLRGKVDEDAPDDSNAMEYHELQVVKVEDSGEKDKKGGTWYNVALENGWVYRRAFRVAPDWEGKTRPFIATFKLDKEGNPSPLRGAPLGKGSSRMGKDAEQPNGEGWGAAEWMERGAAEWGRMGSSRMGRRGATEWGGGREQPNGG